MTTSPDVTRVFIDESGSPDVWEEAVNLEHDRFFTLAATIIKQPAYVKFKSDMHELCHRYEKYLLGKEIKSRYIRYSNPRNGKFEIEPAYEFYKYDDGIKKYNDFNSELKDILKATEYKIVSVSTNRAVAKEIYPHINFHRTLLTDLWERIAIYNYLNGKPKMFILFDPCKANYDEALKDSYFRFIEQGSSYVDKSRLPGLQLNKYVYPCDSENSRGIQLSDLCAYPIKIFAEKNKSDYFSEMVKPKLYGFVKDKRTGKTINVGMKISLNTPKR